MRWRALFQLCLCAALVAAQSDMKKRRKRVHIGGFAGPFPGWGVEMPAALACGGGACASAPPATVDLVVSAYDKPVTPMIRAVLAALPATTHTRVFLYLKGAGAPGDVAVAEALGAPAAVRRLPNVGRCDHSYLAHVRDNYDSLANVTFFLKDTTLWHAHLGQMANVLALAARVPANLDVFCGRKTGAERKASDMYCFSHACPVGVWGSVTSAHVAASCRGGSRDMR